MSGLPGMRASVRSIIPNSILPQRPGVVSGSFGRLVTDAETFPDKKVDVKDGFRASGVLSVNRGKWRSMHSVAGQAMYTLGDRISGPASEPASALRSQDGFKGKIIFDTPTTSAPTFRAAFAGGSADSVPTVTVMTPSQSRIATTLTKKRMIRRAGRHLFSPYQRPALYDQTAPKSAQQGPFNEGSRNRRSKAKTGGNIKHEITSANITTILEPPNQADTDITSQFPNPIEPLPPGDPIEQQGNQYSNFRTPLRIPFESRDFPVLSANRGLDRNLTGKGPEMGPFDTEAESDDRLAQVHGIVWG